MAKLNWLALIALLGVEKQSVAAQSKCGYENGVITPGKWNYAHIL